jgi:hypothetical protein
MPPWQQTLPHAAASAATASAAATEVHKAVNVTTVNINVTLLVSLFLAILANLASQTHLANQPTQTLLARSRGPLSAGACLRLRFSLLFTPQPRPPPAAMRCLMQMAAITAREGAAAAGLCPLPCATAVCSCL